MLLLRIRISCLLLSSIGLLLSVPEVGAFPAKYVLEIKAHGTVVGPYISLAEISRIIPRSDELMARLKKVQLGRAAPPGESKDLSLNHIRLQLRRRGLDGHFKAVTGPKIVRVRTAHKDMTRLRLQESVAAFVDSLFMKPGDANLEWSLDFRRVPEKIRVPARKYETRIQMTAPAKRRGYKIFTLQFVCDGVQVQRSSVAAVVRTYEEVLVAARKLRPGQPIAAADLRSENRETTYLAGKALRDLSRATGMRCRVLIPEGKIVTLNSLEMIPAVQRGEVVSLDVLASGVRISTQALAQESGEINEWIRVWNRETRKVLRGKIVDKGKVRVFL